MDRRTFLGTAAAAALAPAAQAATPEDAKLRAIFDRFFEDSLADSPEAVTRLGLDKGPRAAAKSRLDSASLQSLADSKARTVRHLAELKTIDRSKLSPADQPNYDAVLFTLEGDAAAGKRYAYGMEGAGQPYVLSQLTGAYQDIPDFLGSQHAIETRADCEAYLARLSAFGTVMDEEIARVRHDVGLGVIPPSFILERALHQMQGLRASAPDASPLTTQLTTRAKAKGVEGDWAGQAEKVVASDVYPALDRQIALLTELQPRSNRDAGVWKLPDGEAYYRDALRNFTTTSLTPKEVHQMGLETAKELGARAAAILAKQGMTQGTVGERIAALFKDTKYHYANTDEAKEKLIADLNGIVAEIRPRLPTMFGTVPKANVEIRRVPKFIEAGAPGGYYNRPALDGSRPGIYWINLRDSAENPSWTLKTLTYHEAIPGHHLQRSLQQEADLADAAQDGGLPGLRRGLGAVRRTGRAGDGRVQGRPARRAGPDPGLAVPRRAAGGRYRPAFPALEPREGHRDHDFHRRQPGVVGDDRDRALLHPPRPGLRLHGGQAHLAAPAGQGAEGARTPFRHPQIPRRRAARRRHAPDRGRGRGRPLDRDEQGLRDPMNQIDRRSFLLTTAGFALSAAAPAFAQAGSEDAKLRAQLDSMFEQTVDDSPRFATSLGLDKGARAALKSQLDDNSAAGKQKRLERARGWVKALKAIDRSKLSAGPKVDLDVVLYANEQAVRNGDKYRFGDVGATSAPM